MGILKYFQKYTLYYVSIYINLWEKHIYGMSIRIWFRKMFEISKITTYVEFLCIGITQEDIFPIIAENWIFLNSLDSCLKDSLIFFFYLFCQIVQNFISLSKLIDFETSYWQILSCAIKYTKTLCVTVVLSNTLEYYFS